MVTMANQSRYEWENLTSFLNWEIGFVDLMTYCSIPIVKKLKR